MTQILISTLLIIPFLLVLIGVLYLYTLSLASLRKRPALNAAETSFRGTFGVAIPAHNEAGVIGRTVQSLSSASYPPEKLKFYVVADHCTDRTATIALENGAIVFERNEGERGKGPALSWLFQQILTTDTALDYVVIFDADTLVDANFFDFVDRRFQSGVRAIQGRHIIRNPQAGWFPALTWAMFMLNNRYENLGRTNLGFSAKNMGDSIAFKSDILRQYGWGEGLTEDFEFRQKLLLNGIRIFYEPDAIGYGDAASNWKEASAQRQRWLRGSYQASRKHDRLMLTKGIKNHKWALIDGALHAFLPAYSTLTVITGIFLALSLILHNWIWTWLVHGWLALFCLLFLFPLMNLAFEKAPAKAYWVILTGPLFILWRTWLGIYARFIRHEVDWVRTPRHNDP